MAFARPLQAVDENNAHAKDKALPGKAAQPQVPGRRCALLLDHQLGPALALLWQPGGPKANG